MPFRSLTHHTPEDVRTLPSNLPSAGLTAWGGATSSRDPAESSSAHKAIPAPSLSCPAGHQVLPSSRFHTPLTSSSLRLHTQYVPELLCFHGWHWLSSPASRKEA